MWFMILSIVVAESIMNTCDKPMNFCLNGTSSPYKSKAEDEVVDPRSTECVT